MIGICVNPAASSPVRERPDHPVHHAAGGDHVRPRAGVADRLLHEVRQRGVVVDVRRPPSDMLVQHAAVAVIGELAETDVGDDDTASGAASRMAWIACCTTPCFVPGTELPTASFSSGMPNRITAGIPSDSISPASLRQPVDRPLRMAGHRLDRNASVSVPCTDEEAEDEVRWGEVCLADHVSRRRG